MKNIPFILLIILLFPVYGTEKEKVYTARLTAYCACQKCCSWYYDENNIPRFKSNHKKKIIGQTASGKMAVQGVSLALPKEFPFGSKVFLEENGELLGICHDRGGLIYTDQTVIRIDVYMDDHNEALKFGVKVKTVRTVLP